MKVQKIDLPDDCSCKAMFFTDSLPIHKIVVEHDTDNLYIIEKRPKRDNDRICSLAPPYFDDEKIKDFIAPLPDDCARNVLNFLNIVVNDYLS